MILRPFVDYPELVKHICLADVSVNTFVPSLVTDCALPGRVLQSLACGIPVVSTPLKGLISYTGDSKSVVYAPLGAEFVHAVNGTVNVSSLGSTHVVIQVDGSVTELKHQTPIVDGFTLATVVIDQDGPAS